MRHRHPSLPTWLTHRLLDATARPDPARVPGLAHRSSTDRPIYAGLSGRSDRLEFAVITTIAYAPLGASAGRVGDRLLSRPGFALWLNRATGVLFIALAPRLIPPERK